MGALFAREPKMQKGPFSATACASSFWPAYFNLEKYAAALEEYKLAENDFIVSTDFLTGDGRGARQTNIAAALLALPDGAVHEDEALKRQKKAVEIKPNHYPALVTLAEIFRSAATFPAQGIIKTERTLFAAGWKRIPERPRRNNFQETAKPLSAGSKR